MPGDCTIGPLQTTVVGHSHARSRACRDAHRGGRRSNATGGHTRVLVRYAVSSEDDSTNAGRVILQLSASDQKNAVVWEAGCHVAASDGDPSATPSSADQSWWLRVDLTRGRDNRPAVRVRHRHVTARGTSAEETRVLAIGAAETLSLNELSAHTDCGYDRIHITV